MCLEPVWSQRLRVFFFFFQAEDGIRDLVRSRGLGDVYKRQVNVLRGFARTRQQHHLVRPHFDETFSHREEAVWTCLLYTSDAADERSSVDLGGRRIIKKKKDETRSRLNTPYQT